MFEKDISLKCVEKKNHEEVENIKFNLLEYIVDNIDSRNRKIKVKLFKETKEVSLNQLLVGLIFIESKFILERNLNFDDILIIPEKIDPNIYIKAYVDFLIVETPKEKIKELKKSIAKSLECLASFMFLFNEVKGNTINIYDLITLMNKNKKVRDIVNFSINEKLQFADMEESVKKKCDELVNLILNEKGKNCFKDIVNTVSIRQFQQMFVNISLKPDLYGKIYPTPINTNFMRGMRNERDYFINAMGARKSLITNATYVRNSGYLSRKLSLLVLNQKLAEVEDCESDDYIYVYVENKDILKKMKGRNYLEDKVMKVVDHKDTTLLGKKLKIRSPITCKLGGNEICHTCYGALHKVNEFHIGLTGVFALTNKMTQDLLSTKHLLQVNAAKISIPEVIYEFFELDKDVLIAKSAFSITIDSILENDENGLIYIEEFIITKDGIDTHIKLDNVELMLDLIEDKLTLKAAEEIINIEPEQEVFRINIENSELSTPLKKIIKKLESEEKLNENKSISLLLMEFLDLLNKSNINTPSVTMELILRELIRNPNDIQERPTSFTGDDYVILKLTNALLYNKSLAITLAFERIKYVIENNIFFKEADSVIDGLF